MSMTYGRIPVHDTDLGELLIITNRDEEQIRQDDLAHAADFMPEEDD